MGLQDKLKKSVQKTVQAAALTAGLTAGLAGTEARAETATETESDASVATQVERDTHEEPNFFQAYTVLQKQKTRVHPDMLYVMKTLGLITQDGKRNFNYGDVMAAQEKISAKSKDTQLPKDNPYTEYEQKIIADAAEYLSTNPLASGEKEDIQGRIYDILDASGNPRISYTKDDNSWTAILLEHGRSNYSPGGRGHIYINDVSDFVPEVSHAFRNKNNFVGETSHFVMDGLKDIFTFSGIGFSQKAQEKNYKKVGYMEHDTHAIVEPVLEQYLVQDPFSPYGSIETIAEIFAMIDMLRHQQNDSRAVYTWTSEGDKVVAEGKESLKNQLLIAFSQNKELMATLVKESKKEPLLATIIQHDKMVKSKRGLSEANNSDRKTLSPVWVASVQNKRSKG